MVNAKEAKIKTFLVVAFVRVRIVGEKKQVSMKAMTLAERNI